MLICRDKFNLVYVKRTSYSTVKFSSVHTGREYDSEFVYSFLQLLLIDALSRFGNKIKFER